MKAYLCSGLALLLLAGVAVGHAQTLETAPANNGSGGVFMNLQAVGGPLEITGFDASTSGEAGVPVTVEVWVRPGSYAGFTGASAGWTLSQTVTGVTQGPTVRTPFAFNTPIEVPASGTTAVYLHSLAVTAGLRYTGTGSLPPQTTWANDDLSLFSDTARTGNVAFAGGQNSPRTFSGTIRYRKMLDTAPNNNGSGGVFLDLQAVNQGLTVTGFDVPLAPAPATEVTVQVWTRTGSYVGFTDSDAGWTLSQTVLALSAGPAVPAPVTLATPIQVAPAQVTGIYLQAILPAATGAGIRYTGSNAEPPQTSWTDGDLVLFSNAARTGFSPFVGAALTPRTFSGRIRYTKAFETAPNNNGSGGIFLDLQPVGGRLNLTGFDVPMSSTPGTPTAVEVWTRPGSYVGFTGSSAGWTLVQTVSGVTQGQQSLAPFILATPLALPGDGITAVYLHSVVVDTGIRYTGTGSAPPQTLWSNPQIVLHSDTARTGSVAFGGGQNMPRTFSGLLRFNDVLFADDFE